MKWRTSSPAGSTSNCRDPHRRWCPGCRRMPNRQGRVVEELQTLGLTGLFINLISLKIKSRTTSNKNKTRTQVRSLSRLRTPTKNWRKNSFVCRENWRNWSRAKRRRWSRFNNLYLLLRNTLAGKRAATKALLSEKKLIRKPLSPTRTLR